MAASAQDKGTSPFRQFLDSKSPFLEGIVGQNAIAHADEALQRLPPIRAMPQMFNELWKQPFKGVTSDGNIRPNLFEKTNDGIPIESIVMSAREVIAAFDERQRKAAVLPFDAKERRAWQNTHLYFWRHGVRLDNANEQVQSSVLKLLEASMSSEGYKKAVIATETNAFLGKLYNGEGVLNRYSYNFVLFGEPSTTQPWGFSFFGHHLCLNFFIYGDHIEITPTFMGAEPNIIDEGPLAGTKLFSPEQDLGLELLQGLPSDLQDRVRIRETMDPPAGVKGMHTWAQCGAFQDNKIIPLEGVLMTEMSQESKNLVLRIIEQFVIYLPSKARERKMREVRKYMDETYICWIGGFTGTEPFYYRIQSAIIICEFEHCASIFLGNTKPERFHIHTLVRTPNGGDYGQALLSDEHKVEMERLES